MTVLVSDSFNRANSTTTLGTTDNYAGGITKTWQTVDSTWGISSNTAYRVTAIEDDNQYAYIDVGASDVAVTATFSGYAAFTYQGNLAVRLNPVDFSAILVQWVGTNTLDLVEYDGLGNWKIIASYGGVRAVGDVVKIVANGSLITVYLNGIQRMSATSTLNQTLTKHGLNGQGSPLITFDNFIVENFNATLVSDSFNRANSTTTLGSTDSYAGGTSKAWTAEGTVWGINANRSYCVGVPDTGYWKAVVTSISDCIVEIDYTFVTGTSGGLTFRSSTNNNYFDATVISTGLRLRKLVNDTYSTIGSYSFTPVNGVIYRVKAILNGSNIAIFLDGVQRITIVDSFNQTATNHGIRNPDIGGYFDNFVISNLSAGTAYTKSLSDSIAILDSIIKRASDKRLSESVTLTDSKSTKGFKNLSETVVITDSKSTKGFKNLSDTVAITDSAPTIQINHPPSVTIISVDTTKISGQTGINQCHVTFQFNMDVTAWSVNVMGVDYNTGIVADSGGVVTSGTQITAIIDNTELYQEGYNKVNIYGRNTSGNWTPSETDPDAP